VLGEHGDFSLYRFEEKRSGRSTVVVARETGRDRRGEPKMAKWEYPTESAARREMMRMASR
jgi:hypothetical protein